MKGSIKYSRGRFNHVSRVPLSFSVKGSTRSTIKVIMG